MSYIIGSFNLRDFNFANRSSDGTDEKIERDFEKIADIIAKEEFDVVALQEINAKTPLEHLVNKINHSKFMPRPRQYNFCFGEGMPTHSKDPERYGFIWDENRLGLMELPRNKKNPSYYQNAGSLSLIRPPYYGRFSARGKKGGGNFELRIVNTHLKSASSGTAGGNILSDIEKLTRLEEMNILIKQVLPRICDQQEISINGEIMPSYTFLMGDYNLELNRGERAIYKIDRLITTNYTGKYRDFVTVQEEKTSLSTPSGQVSIDDCYANNFDHFTYECDLGTKLILTPQRVEALTKYFKDLAPHEQLSEYRKKISDHVPIKLIVDLK